LLVTNEQAYCGQYEKTYKDFTYSINKCNITYMFCLLL
jgi:hypothetical protein